MSKAFFLGFAKVAGISAALKALAKNKTLRKLPHFALNTAVGSAGLALPTAISDHMGAKDGKSFLSRLKDGTIDMAKWGVPLGLAFGGLKPYTKGHGLHTKEYLKKLRLFKGKNPLVALKPGKQAWKLGAGAAAGAAVNYDPEDKAKSIAKGALGGAAFAAPFAFKNNLSKGSAAHTLADAVVDSPAMFAFGPALSSGVKRYTRYKQDQQNEQRQAMIKKYRDRLIKMHAAGRPIASYAMTGQAQKSNAPKPF